MQKWTSNGKWGNFLSLVKVSPDPFKEPLVGEFYGALPQTPQAFEKA